MKRAVPFVVVAVTVAACSGTPAEPAAVDDCDGLVAIGAVLVEDYLAVIEGLGPAVVRGEQPPPPAIAPLNARGAELDARVGELGCDRDELNRAIALRTADLASDDLAGSLFLDLVRAGAVPAVTGVTEP